MCFLSGCVEIKDTPTGIAAAESFSLSTSTLSSGFEVLEEIFNQMGKFQINSANLLDSNVVLNPTDSTLLDGDGIELEIIFANIRNPKTPVLYKDGIYRNGNIIIKANKIIGSIGSIIEIVYDKDFFIGDKDNQIQVKGTVIANKINDNNWTMNVNNLSFVFVKTNIAHRLTGSFNRTIINGSNTTTSLDNEIKIEGKGTGEMPNGESFNWEIDGNNSLERKMEFGCAKTFVFGQVKIKPTRSENGITLDFDPFNNKACDKVAKAIIGKKDFIFAVK